MRVYKSVISNPSAASRVRLATAKELGGGKQLLSHFTFLKCYRGSRTQLEPFYSLKAGLTAITFLSVGLIF